MPNTKDVVTLHWLPFPPSPLLWTLPPRTLLGTEQAFTSELMDYKHHVSPFIETSI